MVIAPFSSMLVTSSRTTSISGSRSMAAVTASANSSRSTASACPAGTAVWRAISISNEPARRISSFSSQGAVFSLSDFSELEQTSSAKFAVWCAGVERTGRISYKLHGHAAAGALPRGFRAGESGADDANGFRH